MPEITATAVKELRERTGLPMMDCKKALQEAAGDQDKAVEILRKAGKKTMEKRAGRETSFGRVAVYASADATVGAIVEVLCESAPVAGNQEFIQLAGDMASQLATGPGAQSPEQLLVQPSPQGGTLKQHFDDLTNRIREVFRVARIARIEGTCGGYVHHNGATGVLLQFEGGTPELAKDICMHIAAMRPKVVTRQDVDPALVAKEREILAEAARGEGKPEKVIEKMVEGRLRDFFAQQCLLDQPMANAMKYGNATVGKLAEQAGMKVLRFIHWEVGKE
jgi:elongation factor Ts